MKNSEDIVHKRSIPGVLVLDAAFRLLYGNKQALELFPPLQNDAIGELPLANQLPVEVVALCAMLKTCPTGTSISGKAPDSEIIYDCSGRSYSLRAFWLSSMVGCEEPQRIMVLIERVVERRDVDFAAAKKDYGLTKREVEVLQCLCCGLPNKEIASRKFISEYTVKNHIRKIMRSMGVKSRSGILAALR